MSLKLPSYKVKPLNKQSVEKADRIEAGVQGILARQKYKLKQRNWNHNSMLCRSGFMKVSWNPNLYNSGDVQYDVIDPFRLFPDPSVHNIEDVSYFVDVVKMPLWKIKSIWGKKGGRVKPDTIPTDADAWNRNESDSNDESGLDKQISTSEEGVDPPAYTFYGDGGKDTAFQMTKGTATVKLLHIRDKFASTLTISGGDYERDGENKPIVGSDGLWTRKLDSNPAETGWTIIVYSGNTLLEFKSVPYLHKELPYIQNQFIYDGSFWGMDFIGQHISAQYAINRMFSDAFDYLKIMVRPPLFVDATRGIDPKKIIFKEQKVHPVMGNPRNAVHWFTMPPMSSEVFVLPETLRRVIESVSGSQEVTQGKKPGGVTAASAIQALQAAAGVRVALRFMGLEYAFSNVIGQTIALMQQYYTRPQWIRIRGEDGAEKMEELNPEDLKGEWEVMVEAGSGYPTPLEAKFQRLLMLMQVLASIPPEQAGMAKLLIDNAGIPELSEKINKTVNDQAFQDLALANSVMQNSNQPAAQGSRGQESQNTQ